jgi:hypothetical protein
MEPKKNKPKIKMKKKPLKVLICSTLIYFSCSALKKQSGLLPLASDTLPNPQKVNSDE